MATMKKWTGVEGQGSRTVQQFTTFQWIEIGHLSFCSVSTCMFLYLTKSLLIYSLFLWLTLLNPWLWLNMPHLMASNRNLSVVCRSVLPPRTDSDSCWNLYVVRRLICSSTHFYIHLIYWVYKTCSTLIKQKIGLCSRLTITGTLYYLSFILSHTLVLFVCCFQVLPPLPFLWLEG